MQKVYFRRTKIYNSNTEIKMCLNYCDETSALLFCDTKEKYTKVPARKKYIEYRCDLVYIILLPVGTSILSFKNKIQVSLQQFQQYYNYYLYESFYGILWLPHESQTLALVFFSVHKCPNDFLYINIFYQYFCNNYIFINIMF